VTDPSEYRPDPGSVPVTPGVYRFRDPSGRVVYVGKAKNLRSRVNSYFSDFSSLHPRTQSMLTTAASVDWISVANEVEALTLEYAWIKEYDPRFNVRFRDDKSYPYLAITFSEKWPRVSIVREAKRKGTHYFGPYAHAWAIRDTLEHLTKLFPVRTCRDGVFRRAVQTGRPCLLGFIGRCSAPCVDRISESEYRELVIDLERFLKGDADRYLREARDAMESASAQQNYEEAATWRDRLGALEHVLEKNSVVLSDGTDADVIGLVVEPLHIGVEVFHVRAGRLVGERGFVVERAEDLDEHGYAERVLQRLYGSADDPAAVPRQVLLSLMPTDPMTVESWLSGLRGASVSLRIPQRGDKASLLNTAEVNAGSTLARHKSKRSSDLTARTQALQELHVDLDLPEPPLRIECIDVSTLQGADTVASVVVFEDALPKKSDYRTFRIRAEAADDLAAVSEVVRRRYRTEADREDGRYPTSLLVVDGGPAQARAARDALREVGMERIPVVGLAKRMEEVWRPDESSPVILSRSSEALYLLQRIRDEAHRVAVTFHRKRRSGRVSESALDTIPGLGPQRRAALLRHFGSVEAMRSAKVEDIAAVPGIGNTLAQTIVSALASAGGHRE
jgi:excinuclease ABC subunit C